MADFDLLEDVPPKRLPDSLRPLLDPRAPLPEDVRFWMEPGASGSLEGAIGLGALGAVLAFLSLFTLLDDVLGAVMDGRGGEAMFIAAVALAELIGAGLCAWGVSSRLRQHRLIREGKVREGLFLAPDALLVHLYGHCWAVSRSRALAVSRESIVREKARLVVPVLDVRRDDGTQTQVSLEWLAIAGEGVARDLEAWLAGERLGEDDDSDEDDEPEEG